MSQGGGGVIKNGQKSVTYYMNGPKERFVKKNISYVLRLNFFLLKNVLFEKTLLWGRVFFAYR